MGITPYEKGRKFEELIANLFRSRGYEVRHDIKMVGRSGVEHQIDIYAEYKAPLHTSRIIVECKSYSAPIDKDVVMKLISVVNDLGVDRGILITTSYFTPDAVATAKGYNIDLWDGVKLREVLGEMPTKYVETPLNTFYVEPKIPLAEAMEKMNKELRGFLKRRKGEVRKASLIFYPYYEVSIEASIHEVKGLVRKKTEVRIITHTVMVDGITGELCDFQPSRGVRGILSIPKLSEEEARAFQLLMSSRALSTSALASLLSCSTSKARKLIQGLVAKGLVNEARIGRRIIYKPIDIPTLSSLSTISSYESIMVLKGKPKCLIPPRLALSDIEGVIGLIWDGVVRDYKLVFYPYYVCKVEEDGKRYASVVDMLTGKINERMNKIFTSLYHSLPF